MKKKKNILKNTNNTMEVIEIKKENIISCNKNVISLKDIVEKYDVDSVDLIISIENGNGKIIFTKTFHFEF